jgi:ribokinase
MRCAVIGHVEWVDFIRVEALPHPGDIIHAGEAWSLPAGGGGAAAGQLAKLCDESMFFTALGDDEIGHRAAREFRDMGVRVETVFRPTQSRRAIVFVDASGERTITVIGERLGPRLEDELPWGELSAVDAVYFTAGDAGAVRAGRRAKVMVATARALKTLGEAKVELDALVGSAVDPAERYEPGDLDQPPRLVVRTEAERGGTWHAAGQEPVRFTAAPAPGPIVDRYGAGDSFAACLAYALGAQRSPSEAVAFAARCGASVVTGRGPYETQLGAPDAAFNGIDYRFH